MRTASIGPIIVAAAIFTASSALSDGLGGQGLTDPKVFPPPVVVQQSQPVGVTNYSRTLPEEASPARPVHVVSEPGASYAVNGLPGVLSAQAPNATVVPFGELKPASLLYGFNSDNPVGLPIFAQMWDILPNGRPGPLHQAVLRGGVEYSDFNASIVFSTARLQDGREIAIEAIAVSGDSGNTGVAGKVDRHNFERYGSLFLAGLIQGVGEVGLTRLANDGESTTVIVGGGNNVTNDNEPSNGEILAGALRPVGENLSRAAEQGFDRPPTISGESGMPFAVVFTQSITAAELRGDQ